MSLFNDIASARFSRPSRANLMYARERERERERIFTSQRRSGLSEISFLIDLTTREDKICE